MAIANFFHCKISDSVVESPRFIWLVCVCHLVVLSHQKKIGDKLFDLNFANVYEQNKAKLLKEAKVFGMAFMGDGATIH